MTKEYHIAIVIATVIAIAILILNAIIILILIAILIAISADLTLERPCRRKGANCVAETQSTIYMHRLLSLGS